MSGTRICTAGSGGCRPSGRAFDEERLPGLGDAADHPEAALLTGLELPGRLNEFAVVFVSIVLQSLPFVLVGVFASGLVQQRLSAAALTRWLPRRPLGVVLLASVFGFAAPVCDCGVIPLARRLLARGLPAYAAAAFIVAAPVVNPVVLAATAFAFQGNWAIVALRMAMTLSVALAVGLAAAALPGGLAPPSRPAPGGDELAPPGFRSLIGLATAELFDVIFFIVLGALFTAAAQTFVPRGDLAAVGSRPALSVLVLMPVASMLSICSEADAFVARAFAATFSTGAILAFMTIGQIVDLRNGFLLVRTAGARLTALIAILSYALVFLEGWLINAVLRP